MKIIPQETEADVTALAESLKQALRLDYPDKSRVFLFGSWASYQKSFTEGDVDIFVGIPDYDYGRSERLATLHKSTVTIETKEGETYHARRIELHWGDVSDFLADVDESERVELTEML